LAVFLDTSALAKIYHRETGSELVERLVEESAGSCFISRLCVLEMHSVLARKERSGTISAPDLALVRRRFRADVRRRRFRVIALRAGHCDAAETLIDRYGAVESLRTLDALQLACSLDLHRNHLIHSMVTADRVLCRVAVLENIASVNPED
jgi:uncharacterized protein with PIN domain